MKPYIQQKLKYTKDNRLIDEYGKSIMMDWEYPIMKKSAEVICQNGGRVLNIGFGLGLIDSEIQKHPIDEHWIIEYHPDVYIKMLEDGWHLKKNAKILYGDWRFYLPYLPKFDGIYVDTWEEDLFQLHQYLPNILKKNGIYSFFNNINFNKTKDKIREEDWKFLKGHCEYEIETIEIPNVSSVDKQTTNNRYYWNPKNKTYYCPIIKLKKLYEKKKERQSSFND